MMKLINCDNTPDSLQHQLCFGSSVLQYKHVMSQKKVYHMKEDLSIYRSVKESRNHIYVIKCSIYQSVLEYVFGIHFVNMRQKFVHGQIVTPVHSVFVHSSYSFIIFMFILNVILLKFYNGTKFKVNIKV